MPSAYQSSTFTPGDGGDLVTRYSHENVGPANYVIKRNWRRDMDVEIRREGSVPFQPNDLVVLGTQDFPGAAEPITLIFSARGANGKTGVIVGTPTKLYQYFSLEEGAVYALTGPDTPVFDLTGPNTPVYDDSNGAWIQIGANFSPLGHRWEAVNVAGVTVLNNGYDLPVVYKLNEFNAQPIYQLREQGIARVETIEEYNGFLMLADITEITGTTVSEVFTGVSSGAIVAAHVSYAIVSSAPFFTAEMVGRQIIFSDGSEARILAFVSSTQVTADRLGTIAPALTFRIAIGYTPYTDEATLDRTQYKIIWSDLADATNFGSSITGDIAAGSPEFFLDYPINSISVGDEVSIVGAGPSGATMTATILVIRPGQTSFILDTNASTTVTDGALYRFDSLSGLSGAAELQDDSSGILRMKELQGRLVVMKDTSIFVGRFTGEAANPFIFQRVYTGPKTLFWKWVLEKVNGQYLVYAGRNNFYTFDISSNTPREHPKLTLCENLFYTEANNTTEINECYSAHNAVTNEMWIVYPAAGVDKAICYDYLQDTCSTIDAVYTAAATVKKPVVGIQTGPSQDWFLVGKSTGYVDQYAKTDLGFSAWQRNSVNYTSTLKSGLISFGNDFDEKDWRTYVLYLATSSSNPSLTVTGFKTKNAYETPTQIFAKVLPTPGQRNIVPVWYRDNYFQDQVTVADTALNVAIARKTYEASGLRSKSANRE